MEMREETVESVGERMEGGWEWEGPNLAISQLGERGMETGFSLWAWKESLWLPLCLYSRLGLTQADWEE